MTVQRSFEATLSSIELSLITWRCMHAAVISAGHCKGDATPVRQQWSYVFIALTHLFGNCAPIDWNNHMFIITFCMQETLEHVSLHLQHDNANYGRIASWAGDHAGSRQRPSFPGMGIPMLKMRRSRDGLIFNMGIPILVRRHIHMKTVPSFEPGAPESQKHLSSPTAVAM